MKLIAVIFSLFLGAQAFAVNDGGCFDPFGANKNNKISQSMLVTANGISYSSTTSAMTSGTSGCKTSGFVMQDKEAGVFLAHHVNEIESEAAVGGGTHLMAFSELVGCENKIDRVQQAVQSASSPIVKKDFSDSHVTEWLSSLNSQCRI